MEGSSSNDGGPKDASVCQSRTRPFGLTREDRIRRSSDFGRILRRGGRYRTAHFDVRMISSSQGRTRLGIAVGKKVGNACARNRIKRRLREYFRLNRHKMPPSTDMVFIARRSAASLDMNRLVKELDGLFEKVYSSLANGPLLG